MGNFSKSSTHQPRIRRWENILYANRTLRLDNLKHIVVLMMENGSFDHMLGSLKAVNP
jgi:phospholipase C